MDLHQKTEYRSQNGQLTIVRRRARASYICRRCSWVCLFFCLLSSVTPSHLGVASGSPPSTGIVAPVVGDWRVAKYITAFATWRAVTRAFSRFRER
jgi:hypothetical protein